ncbi:MAG: hypothetical protein ACM37W_15375 [Actinomycetota bacterium]
MAHSSRGKLETGSSCTVAAGLDAQNVSLKEGEKDHWVAPSCRQAVRDFMVSLACKYDAFRV